MGWWGGVVHVLLLTCIFFVPMSTIDGYSLSLGTTTVARGRCARFVLFLRPSGGALIGCARNRNRKSFMHMGPGEGGAKNLLLLLSGPAVARDERTGGGERRADRRWRETSGPAMARDERSGGGERRADRRWRGTSGPAVARDERSGGGERRADRRWRETSGPAVARDKRTGGGERRADRRWRETSGPAMARDIFTTLRYLYKKQIVTAKSAFYCKKIQESAHDVKAMYRVTNNIMGRKLPPILPENNGSHADLAKIRHSLNHYDAPPPLPLIDNNHEHCTL